MNFFKKRNQPKQQPTPVGISAGLPRQGDALPESLKARSKFIKRVNCSQCGAPKSLPSPTAYIYCDYCGSLMDYDFRMANADTNAGLTNTVFHRLMAMVQIPLTQAKASGDRDAYRQIYRQVFTQWLQECPMAASPRAKTDMEFRSQLIDYFAECAVVKDLNPQQAILQVQMYGLVAALQRIPVPGSAWRVAGPFWEYAALYKRQMETVYATLKSEGVLAMDPDRAPEGVPERMEYSTFCQAWLPHLSPEDRERLLKLYGLAAEYDEFKPLQTDQYNCGACGSEIHSLPNAQKVICESCGYMIDVGGQDVPCQKCGALLSCPASTNHVVCPIAARIRDGCEELTLVRKLHGMLDLQIQYGRKTDLARPHDFRRKLLAGGACLSHKTARLAGHRFEAARGSAA